MVLAGGSARSYYAAAGVRGHRDRPGPQVGRRFHVVLDMVRDRLRRVRDRRVLQAHCGLESRPDHDRPARRRRVQHGRLDSPSQRPDRCDLSLRCRPNTRRSRIPTGSTTSARHRRSGPSATATTTRWPRRRSGCSRPSCTATRPPYAGGPWRGLDDLEIAVCEWVSWFNTERLHSELGDCTPDEVETAFRAASIAA